MKVAIISAGAPRHTGAFYDEPWELWGINAAYRNVHPGRAWGRIFNLHRFAHLERDCPQYVDWDTAFHRRNPKVPIYVLDSWRGLLKNARIFPTEELMAMPRGHYHASSFDWLVAYAVHLKAKAIHLHGMGFALDSPREEPLSARACLEYWCGYAEGRGIPVTDHAPLELFRQYHLVKSDTRYGLDDVVMVEKRK